MHRTVLLIVGIVSFLHAFSQQAENITVKIINARKQPLISANVELLKMDSSLVKIAVSDSNGVVSFNHLTGKAYLLHTTLVGYGRSFINVSNFNKSYSVTLQPSDHELSAITITAKKPFIELRPDMTVVNLEAGIANIGTTALEALEKLPGITVDKDGNISLKGRSGITVMLDGKPTYLSGAELSVLLSGMSSSQISQVELMDSPPAKYDAAGNAGIINIKTKKNTQNGFNGTIATAYSQGYYPKVNNNISLNYQHGKWNLFANYSFNINNYFTRIYALRTYFENDGTTTKSLLEQPSFLKGRLTSHTLKTGADYNVSANTSLGITVTGLNFERAGSSNNPALWMKPNRVIDSLVNTLSTNQTSWENLGSALHFRHNFSSKRELTADFDIIGYRFFNDQYFENTSIIPGNYSEASKADIPSNINIVSAKADYSEEIKNVKFDAGWKMSKIKTDNQAAYYKREGGQWKDDYGKSNHFIYEENIHALYASANTKFNKLSLTRWAPV
jgi:iron complex outermembrane receptor protein